MQEWGSSFLVFARLLSRLPSVRSQKRPQADRRVQLGCCGYAERPLLRVDTRARGRNHVECALQPRGSLFLPPVPRRRALGRSVLPIAPARVRPRPQVFWKQALVMPNGTKIPIKGTFVDQGTSPEGSTWSMLPLPPTSAGPRCGCSLDVNYKPANYDCGCLEGEEKFACHTPGNCSSGACLPCPETPGSDYSLCDNKGGVKFPPPQACKDKCIDCIFILFAPRNPRCIEVPDNCRFFFFFLFLGWPVNHTFTIPLPCLETVQKIVIWAVVCMPAPIGAGGATRLESECRINLFNTTAFMIDWFRRWDCEASSQVWQNCADITLEV